jgi:hypothetical protein
VGKTAGGELRRNGNKLTGYGTGWKHEARPVGQASFVVSIVFGSSKIFFADEKATTVLEKFNRGKNKKLRNCRGNEADKKNANKR